MMLRYLLIAMLFAQALAEPGMGGLAMNPWMSQWMGGFPPWMMMPPKTASTPPTAVEATTVPAAQQPDWSAIYAGAGSGMALGAFNKQLGMVHSGVKKKIELAQDAIKEHLDTLKNTISVGPKDDECHLMATDVATDIDNQLTTAFEECKMKQEIQGIRVQSIKIKQQMAAYKLAKKSCKMSVDLQECMTQALSTAGGEAPSATASDMLADVYIKCDACVAAKSEELLTLVENAHEKIIVC